jgi:hypothetical protein
MKTNAFLILSFLVLGYGLMAQPVIDLSVMLQPGDIAQVQPFEQALSTFDPGPSGPNVSWDFANVTAMGPSYSWKAMLPSASEYSDSFPTATMAIEVLEDTSAWSYFYQHDANALNLLGAIGEVGEKDTFVYNFSQNTQMELRMPLTYGDQHRDTARGYARIAMMGNLFVVDRTVYRSLRADGYGSLRTPAGTYEDVLRVRVDEAVEDRFLNNVVARQTNHRYFWISAVYKYELLHMDSLVTFGPTGTVTSASTYNYYQTQPISTSIRPGVDAVDFEIYPNPVTAGHLWLKPSAPWAEPIRYSLTDMYGKRLTSGSIPAGQESLRLRLTDISPGQYLIHLAGKSYSATRKLTIN